MSPNVSVIYCSLTNDPKFPGVNNNNYLFYSQIYVLGKAQWKQIMFVSQGVTQGSSATADWNHMQIGIRLQLMLVVSWELCWSCQNTYIWLSGILIKCQLVSKSKNSIEPGGSYLSVISCYVTNYPKTQWTQTVCFFGSGI